MSSEEGTTRSADARISSLQWVGLIVAVLIAGLGFILGRSDTRGANDIGVGDVGGPERRGLFRSNSQIGRAHV